VKAESSSQQIPAVSGELQRALEALRAAPQNTPAIETELHAAEGQLGFMLQAARELDGKRRGIYQPEFVAKAADHMLDSMERVARMYEGN
jgi:hypothetical protein